MAGRLSALLRKAFHLKEYTIFSFFFLIEDLYQDIMNCVSFSINSVWNLKSTLNLHTQRKCISYLLFCFFVSVSGIPSSIPSCYICFVIQVSQHFPVTFHSFLYIFNIKNYFFSDSAKHRSGFSCDYPIFSFSNGILNSKFIKTRHYVYILGSLIPIQINGSPLLATRNVGNFIHHFSSLTGSQSQQDQGGLP